MEHEHDRREFTRVQVKLQAELMSGGNVVIQGQLGNVSFNGMLLDCAVSLPEGTACQVFLNLDGAQGAPCIQARGIVTRVESSGLAVQFVEIQGDESAGHLRNLVLYNSGPHTQQVEREFQEHIGLKSK